MTRSRLRHVCLSASALLAGLFTAWPALAGDTGNVDITQVTAQEALGHTPEHTSGFVPMRPSNRIDLDEVDRRARKLMERKGMVGLAVAVIDDGEVVMTQGYGKTALRLGKPVTGDTVFRWASVSKSVAAATALGVANEGHFGLSSPVEAFVPHVKLPETQRPVTLENLLSHQTGLPRNSFDGRIEDNRSETDVKEMLSEAATVCTPGRCHSYQNVAYDLSTDMVETAIGVPYGAAVNARIFEPLGMETASISHEGLVTSRDWARPHNSAGYPYNSVKKTYFRIPGAAGVNSSVADLAKWVVANMGETPALERAIQQEMQIPRTRTRRRQRQLRRKYPFLRNAAYGLGWRLYDYEGDRGEMHRVVAHRGAVQGYRANVIFDPLTGDGVALLWNSNSSRPHGLAYEIMDQSYGKTRRDWLGLNQDITKVASRYKVIREVSGDGD